MFCRTSYYPCSSPTAAWFGVFLWPSLFPTPPFRLFFLFWVIVATRADCVFGLFMSALDSFASRTCTFALLSFPLWVDCVLGGIHLLPFLVSTVISSISSTAKFSSPSMMRMEKLDCRDSLDWRPTLVIESSLPVPFSVPGSPFPLGVF